MEEIVNANGVELCVEPFGDPAHPLILLLHGAGSTMLSWDESLCARLAGGGRLVVRADSRDAGRSTTYEPGAPAYAFRDLVADAIALLDHFGAPRGHLVGMSVGGAVAQVAALEHPDRVATLTLASSTPGIPGAEAHDLPGPSPRLGGGPPAPDARDRSAVIEYLVESERPYSADFDDRAARELAGRVVDRAADLEAQLVNPYRVDSGDPWRERLGQIAAPTLVVHGAEDPMFPLPHGEALAREIPGATLLTLDRTGHEYFPPHTWDTVVPAILRHTS
jgi:pimeloyl-ACP methyl ester carboxylesterase